MPIQVEDALKQTSTVADQVSKSFRSSVVQVGNAVDGFLKSSPTSAGDALDNVNKLAKSLGSLGMSAVSSAAQAMNQLGSLGTYTKFKDTFKPPQKIKDLSPEDTSRRPAWNGLTYPDDLGEYFIIFTFKSYERKAPITEFVELPQLTINLPIPANLQEQFNMQYSDKQLGIAGFFEENLQKITGTSEEMGKKLGESIRQGFEQATKSPAESVLYGTRTVTGISDSVGSAIDVATGAIQNPFQTLVFQGVNLRSHNFTFRFSPNSMTESERLKQIINEFKVRMHPARTGSSLFLTFPDVVDIKFGKRDGTPYFFKTCFLETMTVNYSPQGTPAFFADTSNPVEVELSLTFKEIKPLTRDDFTSSRDRIQSNAERDR